jgi:hypothetical protein
MQPDHHNTMRSGWFTAPAQVNHPRYKALRAFFVDGLTYQQALRYEFA